MYIKDALGAQEAINKVMNEVWESGVLGFLEYSFVLL